LPISPTDTTLRLAQVPGIVGIKDATGNIERGSDLLKRAPSAFSVFSGDDATAIALMLLGGKGSISVTANVAPAPDAPDVRRRDCWETW
jgi:4-hydroxy-tetrahydrodipicolinate synthase